MCDDARLEKPIHSHLHPNIYKYVDLLIHESLLIYDILRDQVECDLIVIMLIHRVVEVEVPDVNH